MTPTGTAGGAPVCWSDFAAEVPAIAEAGRQLIYQYGPGLAFALHALPRADVDDEFGVSGVAVDAEGTGARDPVYEAYVATGATTSNDTLSELLVDRALHARYDGRPCWPPVYSRWRAS
ncbi:MAG: hypothetical protein ACXVKA_08505 [Acidimicrobiia bacterium]